MSLTCIIYYFRLDEFMAGFNIISLKLKEMYQVMNTYSISILIYAHIPRTHRQHNNTVRLSFAHPFKLNLITLSLLFNIKGWGGKRMESCINNLIYQMSETTIMNKTNLHCGDQRGEDAW